MSKFLHHGLCSEKFYPKYVGTDYFAFYHLPCAGKEWSGFSPIKAILVDNKGRVVFNLECRDCGAKDALKCHPLLWTNPRPKETPLQEFFHLSPKLAKCVAKHSWDEE